MGRDPGHGHRALGLSRGLLACALVALGALGGCASHEPERLDPLAVLEALDALRPAAIASLHSGVTFADGLTLAEASALAMRSNLAVAAAHARLSPLRTEVERADLWPDPQVGWSAGDVVGDLATTPGTSGTSFAAGPSILFGFPRPGELSAKVDLATARLQQAVEEVRALEADVVGDVRREYARMLVAQGLVAVAREQADVAERLRADVVARRAAGEATDLDAELATLPVELLRAEVPGLVAREETARQRLNELLGLPPGARWRAASRLDELEPPAPSSDLERLVRTAIERRPDVAAASWAHRAADAALALERARRWPRLWLGTGVSFELPVFSRFNHFGVKQAARERAAARARVVAAVHDARADVHRALALAEAAHRVATEHADALDLSAGRALAAAEEALGAGQLPLVAVLDARARSIAARREALEARGAWLEAAVELQAATGELAPPKTPPYDPDADDRD